MIVPNILIAASRIIVPVMLCLSTPGFSIYTVLAETPVATNLPVVGKLADPMLEGIGGRQLKPNDQIEITVFGQPELATKTTVDDNGMIVLPLIGATKVAGLSVNQAACQIQELYDHDYLVDPRVTVQVSQMAVLRFTILGQVYRPGSYDFPPNEGLNLLDAVAKSGGFTRLAAKSKVSVQRSVNGKLTVFTLDVEVMAKDREHKPFEILPGDTITVDERIF